MTRDVRMRGFAHRTPVESTLDWVDQQCSPLPEEAVPLLEACGRVLHRDMASERDVPAFARSMMDGFAVIAEDTSGASSYNRLKLRVIGKSMPGHGSSAIVERNTAVTIMTGAPMPKGADAVLPFEKTESDGEQVYALEPVAPGKNVGRPGEDIQSQQIVLSAGRRLRPQDVGVLSSVGVAEVPVIRQPRIRIVVTGNELLPPGTVPTGCRISDANSPMLQALAKRDGAIVTNPGIVPDSPDAILEALRDQVDVVLVSGGSSVGQEDHAPMLLAQHGDLAIHGVAMRPSSPVGMGRLDGKLVFLLPGNPVSCLCAYDFFAGRAIRALGGRSKQWPYPKKQLPLVRKLVSTVGRVDYARVRCVPDGIEPIAISGASVLSSTSRADGFVIIPGDCEGFANGAMVDVYLYDSI